MLSNAFDFYYKAAELKDILRSGAIQWSVKKERMESVAEHIYGCLILAIALKSELMIGVDLGKVLEMITIHELEELVIGDITPLDTVNKSDLEQEAKNAVEEIVSKLNFSNELLSLTDEFNLGKSNEAKFAKAIDKLECVLEFKKYQDRGQVSLNNVTDKMLENKVLREYVQSGKYDLADIFFLFHMHAFEEYGINEEYWFKELKKMKIE